MVTEFETQVVLIIGVSGSSVVAIVAMVPELCLEGAAVVLVIRLSVFSKQQRSKYQFPLLIQAVCYLCVC